MPQRPRDPEFEPPGAENLNETDREFNYLSTRIQRIVNDLSSDAYLLIKSADSEIPEDHAELNTTVLTRVKENLSVLNQLVSEVEKAAKIVEIKSVPADPKQLE